MKFMGTNDLLQEPVHFFDDDKLLYSQRVASHVVDMTFVSLHDIVRKILNIQDDRPANEEEQSIRKVSIPASTLIYCANVNCN